MMSINTLPIDFLHTPSPYTDAIKYPINISIKGIIISTNLLPAQKWKDSTIGLIVNIINWEENIRIRRLFIPFSPFRAKNHNPKKPIISPGQDIYHTISLEGECF